MIDRLAVDIDTAQALERLDDRVAALDAKLDRTGSEPCADMRALGAGLHGRVDALRDELRVEISAVRVELRAEMVVFRDTLRDELRDGLAENRRHTHVFESVRDDIRMIAEGVTVVAARLDSLRP